MTPMAIVFWSVAALLAYTYLGYPLLVALAARVLNRSVSKGCTFPRMSVVIAAFDEASEIEARVQNVLECRYPPDDLEVIVASDGSTDETVSRARALESARVHVLDLPRRGKAAALAAGARYASGDVLVFTDANTRFRADALAMLALSLADPAVGGVAGHTGYLVRDDAEATGRGEDLYWRYDTWLKERETLTGSVVSAHGGMYAVRRELFRPVDDPGVTDDFAISTAVVDQGKRLVFEPRAVGYEETMSKGGVEFHRRVRLMTRGICSVLLRRRLLNPFRHGFYAVALFSRKVLRRIVPLTFPPLLASSLVLADEGLVFALAAAAQLSVIGLAGLGWLLRRTRAGRSPVLYAPLFFCLANLASMVALWNVVRGTRIERWTPQRHALPSAHSSRGAIPSVRVG